MWEGATLFGLLVSLLGPAAWGDETRLSQKLTNCYYIRQRRYG